MIGLAAAALAGMAGEHVRIDYVCERQHPSVDWSPKEAKSIDLALSRDWVPGRSSRWMVTKPVRVAGQATSFRARTGSIGGSEGIRWKAADGRLFTALISISDIVTDLGPGTLWLDVTTPGGRPDKLTCGPTSFRKLAKGSA